MSDLPSLVEFEVIRDYLGVASDSTDGDAVSRLLDAVCAEIRRLTRRDFEGDEGGSYDEVCRIHGVREFSLSHVPVTSITSIARHYFDGTEDDPYPVDEWRLEDAERGRVRLRARPTYVRVVYRTGPESVGNAAIAAQACLDWCKARWDRRDSGNVAATSIGAWSETYRLGPPPPDIARALALLHHATGGGPI